MYHQITTESDLGTFTLDSDEASLTIYDTDDVTKIKISPEDIPSLSDISSATNKSYTGSFASYHTDLNQNFTTTGQDYDINYLHLATPDCSYLKYYSTKQASTLGINITADLNYNVVMTYNNYNTYPDFPVNDNDKSDGQTNTYELKGYYKQFSKA